jgi:hypothetical protein
MLLSMKMKIFGEGSASTVPRGGKEEGEDAFAGGESGVE